MNVAKYPHGSTTQQNWKSKINKSNDIPHAHGCSRAGNEIMNN